MRRVGGSAGRATMLGAIAEPPATSSTAAPTPTQPGAVQVRRALLSVSDKTGIVDFARGLAELGVELVSTGGTAARARRTPGSPSARSRTSPASRRSWTAGSRRCTRKLHAGLLARPRRPGAPRRGRGARRRVVDLVCVNLYPFERTAARAATPTPRGGHREHRHRRPDDDPRRGQEPRLRGRRRRARRPTTPCSRSCATDDARLSMETRRWLAAEAFSYTARYDTAISRWFAEGAEDFPSLHVRAYERVLELPYGENPHQRAAFYEQVGARRARALARAPAPRQGDLVQQPPRPRRRARRSPATSASGPPASSSSTTTPAGRRVGERPARRLPRAPSPATRSAPTAGSSCSTGRSTARPAEALAEQFVEVLLAPGYEDGALEVLQAQAQRAAARGRGAPRPRPARARRPPGRGRPARPGPRPAPSLDPATMHVATERHPTEAEWRDLLFAWAVCAHVKSNAIVLARDQRDRRRRRGPDEPGRQRPPGRREGPVRPARAPRWPPTRSSRSPTGPSSRSPPASRRSSSRAAPIRDEQVIAAAQEAGVAMVLTGRRHFRH